MLVYAEYQDGLVQVLTTFQTTLVLPEDAVQALATERKVELRFTSLPEVGADSTSQRSAGVHIPQY